MGWPTMEMVGCDREEEREKKSTWSSLVKFAISSLKLTEINSVYLEINSVYLEGLNELFFIKS